MVVSGVELNESGVLKLLSSRGMEAALRTKAEEIKATAEALSAQHVKTGDYVKSWSVVAIRHAGTKGDRVIARVRNTAKDAIWVEAGGRDYDGFHVLRLAAESHKGA